MEREFGQLTFGVNGKGFEVNPEPIFVPNLRNGAFDDFVPFTARKFDRFVERVRQTLHGETP